MKEKELIEFMNSLWNRGLISVSPDEFDYEWVVWDYLKLRQPHVVERSEQLVCHHQYMNAGNLQGDAMKICLKCGDYVKAL